MTTYYLGQGRVKIATRIFNGAVNGGLVDLGDCPMLTLSATQKFDDIYESQTGLMNIASHTVTETTNNIKLQMLNFNPKTLAYALQGAYSGPIAAGTVTAEAQMAYNNAGIALANPTVSDLALTTSGDSGSVAAVGITAAGSGGTPGTQYALTFAGGTPTTPATGYVVANAAGGAGTVVITNPGAGYTSPVTATVATITGATLEVVTGGTALVEGTDYELEVNTGGGNGGIVDILPGSLVVPASMPQGVGISAAYSYAAYQGSIMGNTTGLREYQLVFSGVNTKNGNLPVIAKLFRVALDLSKALDFIEQKHGVFETDGMLLPDPTIIQTATQSNLYELIQG